MLGTGNVYIHAHHWLMMLTLVFSMVIFPSVFKSCVCLRSDTDIAHIKHFIYYFGIGFTNALNINSVGLNMV